MSTLESRLPPATNRRQAPNRVKEVRELLGISKAELIRRAPISKRELNEIEDRHHIPRLETARRIVRALGGSSIEAIFPDSEA